MVHSSSVECEGSYFDSSPAAEVSADVVEDLIAVNVAVVVWDGYGLRVVVEFSRDERQHVEPLRFECLMDRRGLVDATS